MKTDILEKLIDEIKQEKDKERQMSLMNQVLNETSRQICEFLPSQHALGPFVIASLENILEGIKATDPDADTHAKYFKGLFKTRFIRISVDKNKLFNGGKDIWNER